MWLVTLARLRIRSQHRVFPFSCWPREVFRKKRRIQISEREAFIQRAWKQSESLVLRVVPDEEFLHTMINNKDVYVDYVYDYVVLQQKMSQKMHAVSESSIMDEDLTALN